MPCHQIRTISVSFRVGNIELLKKAIANLGYRISVYGSNEKQISFQDKYGATSVVDFQTSTIKSTEYNEQNLSALSNQLKRAYSNVVIDEVAKKNKWIKKDMGKGAFQLQRF